MKRWRWLPWLMVFVALIGFADAAYLTAEHYVGGIPTCYVTTGCETVLTSKFATLGPIPVAALGALYYLAIFLLAMSATSVNDLSVHSSAQSGTKAGHSKVSAKQIIWALVGLTTAGFLATLGFMYIQIAVLKALCIYCLVSAGTTTLLFAGSIGLAWHSRQPLR